MYNTIWHDLYSEKTAASAVAILSYILENYAAQSIIEVGCGNAHWSKAAADAGVGRCIATDGSWNNIDKLLIDRANYIVSDLREVVSFGERFDLAVCLEVAEHVALESADKLLQTITNAADVVLFGAAIPLQGGYGHVNEQWPSWWRSKFKSLDYTLFDVIRPKFWTDKSLHYYYRQNAFIYVNNKAQREIEAISTWQSSIYSKQVIIDAVHPEKFEEVASYSSIAGKRLLGRLPSWMAHRVIQKIKGIG